MYHNFILTLYCRKVHTHMGRLGHAEDAQNLLLALTQNQSQRPHVLSGIKRGSAECKASSPTAVCTINPRMFQSLKV